MLCFSIHLKHTWVLLACACGAGCWRRGSQGGYPPVLPVPNPCWESAGAGPGTVDPVGRAIMIGEGFSLPFCPPASETGDVRVLNCPLAVSHGSECPSQLPFCGDEPCSRSTYTFKGEGRGCHQSKCPSNLLGSCQPCWCCSLVEQNQPTAL